MTTPFTFKLNDHLDPDSSSFQSSRTYNEYLRSLESLEAAVNKLVKANAKRLGPDVLCSVKTLRGQPMTDSRAFENAIQMILDKRTVQDATLANRVGNCFAQLCPLFGVILGIANFAGNASGIGPLGLVATGLGAVLQYAMQPRSDGDAILQQLNDISYSRNFVQEVYDSAMLTDVEIRNACLKLVTAICDFLCTSDVTECCDALSGAVGYLNQVLQNHVNLMVLRNVQNDQLKELSAWLSPFDFHARKSELQTSICEGTGTWFLNHEKVQRFMNGELRWLGCEGSPGVGKSHLSFLLGRTLEASLREQQPTPASQFSLLVRVYCEFSKQEQQDAKDLMAMIARQALDQGKQSLRIPIRNFYETHRASPPERTHYAEFLGTHLTSFKHIFILIDALDELKAVSCTNLLNGLQELQNSLGAKLSIFTTSRPQARNLPKYTPSELLNIETVDEDLNMYSKMRIEAEQPTLFELSEELKQLVIDTIIQKAEKRFILGCLHLDSLSLASQGSKGGLLDALEDLSANTDEYYDTAIKRIGGQQDVLNMLSWLVVLPLAIDKRSFQSWEKSHPTQRRGALSAGELQHALAVRPERTTSLLVLQNYIMNLKYLVDAAAGLCKLDAMTGTVSFIHASVQDYLLLRKDKLFPDLEVACCRACIHYLTMHDFKSGACELRSTFDARLQTFPFLEYASRHWCEVQRLTTTWESTNERIEDEIYDLLTDRELVTSLSQVQAYSFGRMKETGIHIPETNGLIMAMQFNLYELMKRLVSEKVYDVNEENEMGQTALDIAVTADTSFTSILLDAGARVASKNRDAWAIANTKYEEARTPERRSEMTRVIRMLREKDGRTQEELENIAIQRRRVSLRPNPNLQDNEIGASPQSNISMRPSDYRTGNISIRPATGNISMRPSDIHYYRTQRGNDGRYRGRRNREAGAHRDDNPGDSEL